MAIAEPPEARGTGIGGAGTQPAEGPSPRGLVSQADGLGEFCRLLCRFNPISLAEMDEVALQDRVDTKYVMSVRQLRSALAALPEHYRVLEIAGTRLNLYRTAYFDTEDFMLYMRHHAGKRVRYKVRSRNYADTGQSFLEVKWKEKRDRTAKDRVPTAEFVTWWVPAAGDLVDSRVPGEARPLDPRVSNQFYRATLVGKRYEERVTLDLDLQFSGDGRTVALPGIAIAEVKQDGVNRRSDFMRQMRAAGIRPDGFSKYCIGVALLFQEVKHNRFKPELRLIDKLMRGGRDA